MTHFGMPALIEFADLDAQVAACRQLGLDFIELNLDCPQYLPDRLAPDHLRAVTAQTGVRFTVHLPEGLDLGSFQAPVRDGYQRYFRMVIDWCAQAGISLINLHLHPGVYFTLPAGKVWLYQQYQQESRNNLLAAFRPLCQFAREQQIILSVENGGLYHLSHVTSALEDLLALGEGILRLTWDVGHDAAAGYADRPFLLAHRDSLCHMHLHDAKGTRNHLPLGEGDAPIGEMLALAATLGISVVLETKTFAGLQLSVERLNSDEKYGKHGGHGID